MDQLKMEQFVSKHHLWEYAVRLEVSGEVGSGFLFVPPQGNEVYIFTALHVILGMFRESGTKTALISCCGGELSCTFEQVQFCLLEQGLLEDEAQGAGEKDREALVQELWELYSDDEYGGKNKDIAAMRIQKTEFPSGITFPEPLAWISEELIAPGTNFVGNGFPNRKKSVFDLRGTCRGSGGDTGLLVCQEESGRYQPFDEAMEGFSGSGLIADYHGRPVLFGFVAACPKQEKQQSFQAVTIGELIGTMQESGWDAPKEYAAGIPPSSFTDAQLMDLIDESMKYMQKAVQSDMKREFNRLGRKFSLTLMAQEEPFYDIPECMDERSGCLHYWAGRYWNLFILDRLNGDAGCSAYRAGNGDELELAFICSEGEGNADMARVVREIIDHRILGSRIKGNTILIWQSKQNPDNPSLTKAGFQNIVANIAEGCLYGMENKQDPNGYDLLDGEMSRKDYGMIHIKWLVNRLGGCKTMGEVTDQIREALNEIWR